MKEAFSNRLSEPEFSNIIKIRRNNQNLPKYQKTNPTPRRIHCKYDPISRAYRKLNPPKNITVSPCPLCLRN